MTAYLSMRGASEARRSQDQERHYGLGHPRPLESDSEVAHNRPFVNFVLLGIDYAKHSIGHGGSFNGMTWDQMEVMIRRFHFEQIARLMKKLEAVPEGNGTMLDHTTIVYLSDAAEGHHSRCWEWPFVVIAGRNSGIQGGRYIEYPYWGKQGHKTIGNLYATFLHSVGDGREHFGVQEPMLAKDLDLTGPLAEVLA